MCLYCSVTMASIYWGLTKCWTLVFMDQHIKSINPRTWLLLIPIADRGESYLERSRQVPEVTEWTEDGDEIWRLEVRIWTPQRLPPCNLSQLLFWIHCTGAGVGGEAGPQLAQCQGFVLVPGSMHCAQECLGWPSGFLVSFAYTCIFWNVRHPPSSLHIRPRRFPSCARGSFRSSAFLSRILA